MAAADRGAYAGRLDDDYWAYVDRVAAFFPEDLARMPLAEQRQAYDRMCRALHPGRPVGVTTKDETVEVGGRSIPIRRYRPEHALTPAILLFLHGGGFVFGGLDSHDDTVADLCEAAGIEAVSADYRLAPEHPHPAAFEDALSVFDALAALHDRPIILAGESAGAALAAAVAQARRKATTRPAGQLLIYPALGGPPGRSHREHAAAPLLSTAEVEAYRRLRAGGEPPANDPTFDPLADTDFAGLPPTVIVTAEYDPLSSEGEAYRDRIEEAGGVAAWREEPRLTHSFLRARAFSPRAREAFRRIVDDLSDLARQAR